MRIRSRPRLSPTSSDSLVPIIQVKIEITVDVPEGVPDNVVRTVTENAKTLKFEQHGFEES